MECEARVVGMLELLDHCDAAMTAAALIPVPAGSRIQRWHWWRNSAINMTEAEREHYYGFPCSGDKLSEGAAGTLFEVRVIRPLNDQAH